MESEMSAKQAARELRHMRAGIKYALTLPVVSDEDKEDREIDEIQVTALNMGIKALEKEQTALEDIKAEIKQWYWQADKQKLAQDPCVVDAMIDLFIRTVDKHISRKE